MPTSVLLGTIGSTLFSIVLLCVAVFLILLVLVQRGRGGGLSGAFGGMGGQSAFGTKAGDTFTRITVVTATVWIVLCVIAAKYLGTGSRLADAAEGETMQTREVNLDDTTFGAGPLGTETGAEPSVTDANVIDVSPASGVGGTNADTAGGNAAVGDADVGGDAAAGSAERPATGDEN